MSAGDGMRLHALCKLESMRRSPGGDFCQKVQPALSVPDIERTDFETAGEVNSIGNFEVQTSLPSSA
jgi:hypothetical protein